MILLLTAISLLAGLSLGMVAFATSLALLMKSAKDEQLALVKQELKIETLLRVKSERDYDSLKEDQDKVSNAIEANSLPWIPKTEAMQAKYESEAIDRMENPSYYSDVVDGLGR